MSHRKLQLSASDTAGSYSRAEHYDYARRYGSAPQHLIVARGLWNSYEQGAFPRPRATGPFFHRSRRYALDQRLELGSVLGPVTMPGLSVRVAGSDEEARRPKKQTHRAKDFAKTLAALGRAFGRLDFSQYDLDAPFPAKAVKYGENSVRTQAEKIARVAREENLSLGETVLYFEGRILNRTAPAGRPPAASSCT
jgi:hypothetical protein